MKLADARARRGGANRCDRALRTICVAVTLGAVPLARASESPWEKLQDCRIVASPQNDGDSFEIKCNGHRRPIRIFFVDCFEQGPDSKARRTRQAEYFGIPESDREAIGLQAASAATEFTAAQLEQPFTVYVRRIKEDAADKNSAERAFVTTAEGHDLGELLVSAGLAVIRDSRAASEHPDGRNISEQISALRAAETRARREGRGIWHLAGDATALPPPPEKFDFAATDRAGLFASAGCRVTAHGRVERIVALPNDRIIFVNFENNEEGDFVGIIRADFLPVFQKVFPGGLAPALVGEDVTLRGIITLYRNTPQIELQRPGQISLRKDANFTH